jgi:hypothetical protein
MSRQVRSAAGVLAFFTAAAVLMTWPQAAHLSSHVPAFDDPLLSIWRLSWIAHALATSPADLMNGNIFYPEPRTLAYTDAVLLQGFIAAPLILLGMPAVTVYNLLVLGSIALSGAAMCLLASRLTGRIHAGVVAGFIYAFVPFRFDHYLHLELHATVFLPLGLWFLDRAFEEPRWRDVAGFGASMVLQVLSGIYYTVFLATALVIAIPVRCWRLPRERRIVLLRRLAVVAVAAGIVVSPYLSVYVQNRGSVGERTTWDLRLWSATPVNYLATPADNLLYGRASDTLGAPERRLFPGLTALALAAAGVIGWHARKTSLLVIGASGFILSLGINTPVYAVLREIVFIYRGLRAPARASILVFLAVAALAAYGWAAILGRRPRASLAGTTAVLVVLTLEYATLNHLWLALPARPPDVARWLAAQPRSVVVEFPLPTSDSLDRIHDGLYMYASTFHWQPMLNGYSGFYPQSYIELIERMRGFPSEDTIVYLKQRQVDLILLHGSYMKPDRLGTVAAALAARHDVQPVAEFLGPNGPDLVFRLVRANAP